MTATFALQVRAPAGAVFDYLTDPRNRPQWQSSLRSVDVLDDGPVRVGMRWVDRTAVGANPHMEIRDLIPPSPGGPGVWTEVGHWHGLRAELTLRFEEQDGGTLLGASIRLTSGPAWLPVRVVLQGLAPPAVRSDLRRAARVLESA